jgi:hypothetical protein
MWITVENMRNSGDFNLGIFKAVVQGFRSSQAFPQSSPQLFTEVKNLKLVLRWREFCNYIEVIIDTHKFTAVITTNYKYKNFSRRVPISVSYLGAAI